MPIRICPDYDNDEAMARVGRFVVDTYLNVRWNGRQEECSDEIAKILFTEAVSACTDEEETEETT